jgi:hypothetical protein
MGMRHALPALSPIVRARTLGALVLPGEHAVAYTGRGFDNLLAGFAEEGLNAGERVLILPGNTSTRAAAARLRAQGVAAPPGRPTALRIWDPSDVEAFLPEFLSEAAAQTLREGYEGLRVAHACTASGLRGAMRHEARWPRRFDDGLTLLCVYPARAARSLSPEQAWALAQFHERILCL